MLAFVAFTSFPAATLSFLCAPTLSTRWTVTLDYVAKSGPRFRRTNSLASVGRAIEQSRSVEDLMEAATMLWIPTDPNLPPHYMQEIHHEKRQRWASQLLAKLGSKALAADDSRCYIWNDDRFRRAIAAAATPFPGREVDRANVEGRTLSDSLIGLVSVVGRVPPGETKQGVRDAIVQMIARAECMANDYALRDAVETRFASRTLLARLPGLASDFLRRDQAPGEITAAMLAECLPDLDMRVSGLPFDVVPLGLDWSSITDQPEIDQAEVVSNLREHIPFNFDSIVTRSGTTVIERRGTAWVAEEGIGALAYSGKLMRPRSLPDVVRLAMRETERAIFDGADNDRPFFDCALCNHYPDTETACKFHTDPEHGSLWDRLTCVVSAGDNRRFAFRPIPELTVWDDWDNIQGASGINNSATNNAPAVIHFFAGDVIKMFGRCNDDFHHAVFADDVTPSKVRAGRGQGRVSLVLKRAIDRGGKRGHGLSGEGRRSRTRQRSARVSHGKTQPQKRKRANEKAGSSTSQ